MQESGVTPAAGCQFPLALCFGKADELGKWFSRFMVLGRSGAESKRAFVFGVMGARARTYPAGE